jgi:hypothetical protein
MLYSMCDMYTWQRPSIFTRVNPSSRQRGCYTRIMTARVQLQRKKLCSWASRGLAPRRTDWRYTASRKVTLPQTNTYMYKREKNLDQKSRRDLKPRMTVLAKASSNLTDRPLLQSESVRVWGCCETPPGGGGVPIVGSRCVATPSEDAEDLVHAIVAVKSVNSL